jgi:hypothetical protein
LKIKNTTSLDASGEESMKRIFAVLLLTAVVNASNAAPTAISAVPTSWKVESYLGSGVVVLWFTGSPCANGQLVLPASATATDHNRLFTAVMTAKAAGKTMVIFYDSASCVISSFGVQ